MVKSFIKLGRGLLILPKHSSEIFVETVDAKANGREAFGAESGNTKGGSITVPLTSCLSGLESAV